VPKEMGGTAGGTNPEELFAVGGFKLAVALDVTLPSVTDPETAAQLIREAHQVCPYSNATRGNIDVELLLGGKPI